MHRVARQLRSERLERHCAPEARVMRQIHAAHAAAAELTHDRIRAEHRPGLKVRVVFEKMRRGFGRLSPVVDGIWADRGGAVAATR